MSDDADAAAALLAAAARCKARETSAGSLAWFSFVFRLSSFI